MSLVAYSAFGPQTRPTFRLHSTNEVKPSESGTNTHRRCTKVGKNYFTPTILFTIVEELTTRDVNIITRKKLFRGIFSVF